MTSSTSLNFTGIQKSGVLDLQFLDAYLPSQPNLLCALTIIGFISFLTFAFFLLYFIARHFGICSFYDSDKTHDGCRIIISNVSFVTSWGILCVLTLILALAIQRLGHVEHAAPGLTDDMMTGTAEKLTMNVRELCMKWFLSVSPFSDPANGHFVTIDLYQITIVNDSSIPYTQVDEVEVLNKYTEIRELGYEFKPLEADDVLFQQHLLFGTITAVLFISLALAALGLVVGLREHTVDIHPMDRSALSNAAGRILLGVGTFWFAISPFLGLLGAVMMAYGHAHSVVCPYAQAELQNKGIEAFTNANIAYFDLNNLIDFLTDLQVERTEVNDANCTLYAAPLEAMWMCLLLTSWISLIASFIAIRLSTCFLRTSAKFSWDPSETYSTIPDKRKISMPFPGVFIPKGY